TVYHLPSILAATAFLLRNSQRISNFFKIGALEAKITILQDWSYFFFAMAILTTLFFSPQVAALAISETIVYWVIGSIGILILLSTVLSPLLSVFSTPLDGSEKLKNEGDIYQKHVLPD